MSQCQQARILLSQIKAFEKQLSQEWRMANGEWREKRKNWYSQLQATSYQLKVNIEQLESMLYVSEQEAEKILSEKKLLLGSEAVKELFDIELKPADIPPIPFSRLELEQAVELDQVLMLVIDKDKGGNSLTAKRIGEMVEEIHPALQGFFHNINTAQYETESLYNQKTTTSTKWVLITRHNLPHSSNKNFLQQTQLLITYLSERVLPSIKRTKSKQIYQQAIEEFGLRKKQLAMNKALTNFDAWTDIANEEKFQLTSSFVNLKINQLARPDIAILTYFLAMYLYQYGEPPLSYNEYTWLNNLLADGSLVYADITNNLDNSYTRIFSLWSMAGRGSDIGTLFIREL